MNRLALLLLPLLCLALGCGTNCHPPPAGQKCVTLLPGDRCSGAVQSGGQNSACKPGLCSSQPSEFGVSVGGRCWWTSPPAVSEVCPGETVACFAPSTTNACIGAISCTSSAQCGDTLCQDRRAGAKRLCLAGQCFYYDPVDE